MVTLVQQKVKEVMYETSGSSPSHWATVAVAFGAAGLGSLSHTLRTVEIPNLNAWMSHGLEPSACLGPPAPLWAFT